MILFWRSASEAILFRRLSACFASSLVHDRVVVAASATPPAQSRLANAKRISLRTPSPHRTQSRDIKRARPVKAAQLSSGIADFPYDPQHLALGKPRCLP